jgi:hypothetical protein
MRKGSLLRKLIPPLAGAVAFITLAALVIGVITMRGAVLERARRRAQALSIAERDGLERLMRAGEHGDLQQVVEQIARTPDLAAVRVLRADGTVHASSNASEVGRHAGDHGSQTLASGDLRPASLAGGGTDAQAVHVLQPLLNKPACQRCHAAEQPILGYLDLDVGINQHSFGMMTFGTLIGLIGLAYLAAVVGVMTPLVALVVGRPVRQLVEGMRTVQAGDLDVEVQPAGTRELDSVIGGFNGMVDQLRRGRAAEETARRLELERVEQMAAVGQLAAGLAHEIRNPLAGVKGVIDIVARDTVEEGRKGALREASNELMRIDQIVRELLQYARPKPPVVAAFDLGALVAGSATLAVPDGGTTPGRVRCSLGDGLPPALGDAAQVRQVVVNLLLNAQQAAGPGGEVTIETGALPGRVWCRVRDTGPGVPADKVDQVFRPFFTTKARGTGLGLSISRRIAEMQGGSLTLDNPGEPGAAFTLTLPSVADHRVPASA